jgi:hypothetical protein
MRYHSNIILPSLFLSLALLILSGCAGMQRKVKVDILPDIPYAAVLNDDGTPLFMDVVRSQKAPEKAQSAIIIVPGGRIPEGARKQELQRKLAHSLAQRGYVCFLLDYRLPLLHLAPEEEKNTPFLERMAPALMDVKTAMGYIRKHGADYNINPDRLVLLGDSAGSVIALAVGVAPADRFLTGDQAPVQASAIVNLWGTADYFPELFGRHTPPIMSVHGEQDFFIGYSLTPALNIDTLCKQYQIPHYFFPVPMAEHGAWNAVVHDRTLPELIDLFLQEVLKEPEP